MHDPDPGAADRLGAGRPDARSPAATLQDLGAALSACFQAPEGSAGAEVTVLLSLTRQGMLLGKPRITYSKLPGRAADGKAFVAAALASLVACTPVAITPGLGGAIAGRVFTIRFVGGGRSQSI